MAGKIINGDVDDSVKKKSKKTSRTEKGKAVKHTNPGSLYSYNSFQKIQKQFRTNLKERCDRICNCCGGLWFPKSVRNLSKDTLRLKGITNDFINSAFYVDPSSEVFCQTCRLSVMRGKLPKLALTNGLDFPKIPEVVKVRKHTMKIINQL